MPIAAIVFGWPAVAVSIVLGMVGVATARARLVFAGAVAASPFLFYLVLTPRFHLVAVTCGLLYFIAPVAVARGRRTVGLALIAPFLCVAAFVAYSVRN